MAVFETGKAISSLLETHLVYESTSTTVPKPVLTWKILPVFKVGLISISMFEVF